jgi:hypothetical protein
MIWKRKTSLEKYREQKELRELSKLIKRVNLKYESDVPISGKG